MTIRAFATVTGPTATFTAPSGATEPLAAGNGEDIRRTVIRRASDEARRNGHPLELITTGDHGVHHLLIDTDGTIAPLPSTPSREVHPEHGESPAPDAATPDDARVEPQSTDTVAVQEPVLPPSAVTDEPDGGRAPRPERVSFVAPPNRPAPAGAWQRVLAALGLSGTMTPPALERARHVDLVSRQWAGHRTIAVANGKGGVGKTLTTAMLAAVFGRHGGGNVLAWDNNDTRGTLGWRTDQGLYDTTIRDILPVAPDLLGAEVEVSAITRFVHHQAADRYDVLRSNPKLLAADQRLTTGDFTTLMRIAARYFRLVIFDSGNDESADRWLSMIDATHQLVIPTLTAPESAESAALLLDALRERDPRSAALADRAVVIVTQAERSSWRDAHRTADGFEGHVRDVRIIPFDPALKSGPLRLDALRATTRDAWLAAAASAAEGL